MLVLSRKIGESVTFGHDGASEPTATVTVLAVGGGSVKLGFEAKRSVLVHRLEIWKRGRLARPAPGAVEN